MRLKGRLWGRLSWACIHMSRNSVLHHKTKHIDVRVYHLRDLCRAGIMNLLKISTNDMVADALTKALPRQAFCAHCKVMLNENAGTKVAREGWWTAVTVRLKP
eukprot:905523-Rhodomonas_salina.1